MTVSTARESESADRSCPHLSDLMLPVVRLATHGTLEVSCGESEVDEGLLVVELVGAE